MPGRYSGAICGSLVATGAAWSDAAWPCTEAGDRGPLRKWCVGGWAAAAADRHLRAGAAHGRAACAASDIAEAEDWLGIRGRPGCGEGANCLVGHTGAASPRAKGGQSGNDDPRQAETAKGVALRGPLLLLLLLLYMLVAGSPWEELLLPASPPASPPKSAVSLPLVGLGASSLRTQL